MNKVCIDTRRVVLTMLSALAGSIFLTITPVHALDSEPYYAGPVNEKQLRNHSVKSDLSPSLILSTNSVGAEQTTLTNLKGLSLLPVRPSNRLTKALSATDQPDYAPFLTGALPGLKIEYHKPGRLFTIYESTEAFAEYKRHQQIEEERIPGFSTSLQRSYQAKLPLLTIGNDHSSSNDL